MTKLLLQIFIKDNENTQDNDTHAKIGKFAGTVGIVCNTVLGCGKLITGAFTNSVSIIADGFNNLSDAVSFLVTFLGFRLSQFPADREHPYGHARSEYVSGLIVSVLILLMGIETVKSSIEKILHPTEITLNTAALIFLLISILTKLWLFSFNRTLGNKISSATLAATAADSRNDAIATTAVLLGFLINKTFAINADGYIGLAVAVFIFHSGISMAKESGNLLLGKAADEDMINQISSIILADKRVLGIHDLLMHDYGPGKCYASVHAELSADENPLVCHDILDSIEKQVAAELNVQLVIHCDPIVTDTANDRYS